MKKEKIYFRLFNSSLILVEVEKVNYDVYLFSTLSEFNKEVCEDIVELKGRIYHMIDRLTGLSIVKGTTRKEVFDNFKDNINKYYNMKHNSLTYKCLIDEYTKMKKVYEEANDRINKIIKIN